MLNVFRVKSNLSRELIYVNGDFISIISVFECFCSFVSPDNMMQFSPSLPHLECHLCRLLGRSAVPDIFCSDSSPQDLSALVRVTPRTQPCAKDPKLLKQSAKLLWTDPAGTRSLVFYIVQIWVPASSSNGPGGSGLSQTVDPFQTQ